MAGAMGCSRRVSTCSGDGVEKVVVLMAVFGRQAGRREGEGVGMGLSKMTPQCCC